MTVCFYGLDRGLGEHYKILEMKRMVTTDPSMLDGFMLEEEEMANNLAAGTDAMRTVERLMEEIMSLAECAGMIGFAMFTWGHVHNTTIPVTIKSWGVLEFFGKILKKDPADVSALFELRAVSRE
ncbi:hypothetical protein DFH09DRAFT_1324896 [Mycena vulgaris]|nr:hypothetical protein DFH09DRAFT_1324896 [Mycena vulgaris]